MTWDNGDLECIAVDGGNVVEIERYCILSGRLGRRAGDGSANGAAEVGDTSSNRSNTTTVESVWLRFSMLWTGLRLMVLDACGFGLTRRLLDAAVSAYSGSSAKLEGVTTTPYVPGRCVSAFRSRSSSVVSVVKGGRSSYCRIVGLTLGLERARAVVQLVSCQLRKWKTKGMM
jgi:hypothetical protein